MLRFEQPNLHHTLLSFEVGDAQQLPAVSAHESEFAQLPLKQPTVDQDDLG
jgi:hypothetical protein